MGGRHHLRLDREGWLYLAVVAGSLLAPVHCLGDGEPPDSGVDHGGAHHAMEQPTTDGGVLHHTDRGAQYAATLYREMLAGYGLTASMSRRGNCWDNAVVESFFHTLKTELVYHRRYITREEARQIFLHGSKCSIIRTRRHQHLAIAPPLSSKRWRWGLNPGVHEIGEDQHASEGVYLATDKNGEVRVVPMTPAVIRRSRSYGMSGDWTRIGYSCIKEKPIQRIGNRIQGCLSAGWNYKPENPRISGIQQARISGEQEWIPQPP